MKDRGFGDQASPSEEPEDYPATRGQPPRQLEEEADQAELEEQFYRDQREQFRRLDEEAEAAHYRQGGQAASSSRGPAQPSDRPISPVRRRRREDEWEANREYQQTSLETSRRSEISRLETRRGTLVKDLKWAQDHENWAEVSAISAELSGLELKLGSLTSSAAGSWSQPTSSKGQRASKGSAKGYPSGKAGSDKWRRA